MFKSQQLKIKQYLSQHQTKLNLITFLFVFNGEGDCHPWVQRFCQALHVVSNSESFHGLSLSFFFFFFLTGCYCTVAVFFFKKKI